MKAIVHTAPGRLAWQDLPVPEPGPGQVRIRTAACGICATDLEMIAGWSRTTCPAIPGHEWAGHVDAVGPGADPGLAGLPCVADNVLAGGGEVGFEHPGGYAECFLTEARNVRPLPPELPPEVAALIEPVAVALRGLKRLEPAPGRPVLVFGDGPLGLILVLLLQARGSGPVSLAGGRANRLELARAFGAAGCCNYHAVEADLARGIRGSLGGDFGAVIEASGSAAAARAALELAAPDARILILGDYGARQADFPWNRILHRELRLIGSNASAGAWDEAVAAAATLRDRLARLVTHRFPAARFEDALDVARQRAGEAVKVVLDWRAEPLSR